MNKIVVGKSINPNSKGYVEPKTLGQWAAQAEDDLGWNAGIWFEDFSATNAIGGIAESLAQFDGSVDGVVDNNSGQTTDNTDSNTDNTNTNTDSKTDNTNTDSKTDNTNTDSKTNNTNTVINNTNTVIDNTNTDSSSQHQIDNSNNGGIQITGNYSLPFPIYFGYANGILSWSGDNAIAAGLGAPGYMPENPYNYFALSFWLSSGPADLARVWAEASTFLPGLGSNTQEIQKKLKKAYNDAGKKVLISAFGATQFPTSEGKDPVDTADALADFVLNNNVDGVDIDWEDNAAMNAGTGEQWLIKFQKQLRKRMPNHIITHAPQGPYFKEQHYKNDAYMAVHRAVGDTIDFYTVQFYNQGDTKYDSYEQLYIKASGYFSGTSVKEVIDRGIPSGKVVVGKPATMADVYNTGYVDPADLGQWMGRFYREHNVEPSCMFWQLKNDAVGKIARQVLDLAGADWKNYWFINANGTSSDNYQGGNSGQNTDTIIDNIIDNIDSATDNTVIEDIIDNIIDNPKNDNSSTNNTNTNNSNSDGGIVPTGSYDIPFPIYFGYANGLASWWGEGMLAGMGIPGYAPQTPYNYMCLSFWLTSYLADLVQLWATAGTSMSFLGSSTDQIQKKLKKKFNDEGRKILISAFGATEFPTTGGKDPIKTAEDLATFVLNNNVDGVDIDWEDNEAMNKGIGEEWLIKFQRKLRQMLPNHIITHAPQAPYFKEEYYQNDAYMAVHREVGHTIDFYTVQFYNQGDTQYNSYEELFIKATGTFSGTSVQELIDRGIPSNKIVLGKPATQKDVYNTGYVKPTDLGMWLKEFMTVSDWEPSLMFWQFKNDADGKICQQILDIAEVNWSDFRMVNGDTAIDTVLDIIDDTQSVVDDVIEDVIDVIPDVDPVDPVTPHEPVEPVDPSGPDLTIDSDKFEPMSGASHTLSMFYCGFGGDYCGQSTDDDVNPKSSAVILAFVNIGQDGGIIVDHDNFPLENTRKWQAAGSKVLLSVGGQNGHWDPIFKNQENTDNFIDTLLVNMERYNLDGIDIDIESYHTPPNTVSNMLIALKKLMGKKILVVSPECVAVYQETSVPDPTLGGQAFNYFVPIIRHADAYIDYYQPQAYNNWYGGHAGGSLDYLKEVYLNWVNLQGLGKWASPIPEFSGVKGEKLLMGVLASTRAGGSQYYAPPSVIREFKAWIKENNYPLNGFMMWDSNWDKLNDFVISDATVEASP